MQLQRTGDDCPATQCIFLATTRRDYAAGDCLAAGVITYAATNRQTCGTLSGESAYIGPARGPVPYHPATKSLCMLRLLRRAYCTSPAVPCFRA
jgi:hypothetical protein